MIFLLVCREMSHCTFLGPTRVLVERDDELLYRSLAFNITLWWQISYHIHQLIILWQRFMEMIHASECCGGSECLNCDWPNHFSVYRGDDSALRDGPSGGTIPTDRRSEDSIAILTRFLACTLGVRLRCIAPLRDGGLFAWILAIMCCHVSRRRRPSPPEIRTAACFNI